VNTNVCMDDFLILACPVIGQTRQPCASPATCHSTCENYNTTRFCPAICVVNGCECPPGTVIDEVLNQCVKPDECLGMHIHTYIYVNLRHLFIYKFKSC